MILAVETEVQLYGLRHRSLPAHELHNLVHQILILISEKGLVIVGLLQGEQGSKGGLEGLGWRGLLEGVCHQVNDQLTQALDGSQRLLGRQQQVTSLLNTKFCHVHCAKQALESVRSLHAEAFYLLHHLL